jgi:serine/threonine protein kinase
MIMARPRGIGDYVATQQIGAGSFAVVWKAYHKQQPDFHLAIKEIITERLNKKLQESLRSEIAILRRTDHPNIIRLHDIVEVSSRFCWASFLVWNQPTNRVWIFTRSEVVWIFFHLTFSFASVFFNCCNYNTISNKFRSLVATREEEEQD